MHKKQGLSVSKVASEDAHILAFKLMKFAVARSHEQSRKLIHPRGTARIGMVTVKPAVGSARPAVSLIRPPVSAVSPAIHVVRPAIGLVRLAVSLISHQSVQLVQQSM